MTDAAPAAPPPGRETKAVNYNEVRQGMPILGGLCGFLFGLFLGLDLWILGIIGLNSPLLIALPVLGLVSGVVFARLRG